MYFLPPFFFEREDSNFVHLSLALDLLILYLLLLTRPIYLTTCSKRSCGHKTHSRDMAGATSSPCAALPHHWCPLARSPLVATPHLLPYTPRPNVHLLCPPHDPHTCPLVAHCCPVMGPPPHPLHSDCRPLA